MADEPTTNDGQTERMAEATTVMEVASGDTGEFLKILGDSPAAQGGSGAPAQTGVVGPAQDEAKPIVIKGGPRRVVRADGRAPDLSLAIGQRRFALSSGHEMFAPKRKHGLLKIVVAVLVLAAVSALFVWAMGRTVASITHDRQMNVVGTSDYDGALSVTPANDGGYYTVFFVTSTPTDENQIGTLSETTMYRTDKEASPAGAVRVTVPRDLAVSYTVYDVSGNPTTQTRSLSDTLEVTQSLTRCLQGICDGFGLRLYNVVCCDAETFALLGQVLDGSLPPESVDAASLLGSVRSNLSLEEVVQYCGKIGAMDQASIPTMSAPTTPVEANGSILARGSSASYSTTLAAALGNHRLDDRGYYLGTSYDEAGNPILDDYGNPVGALFDENGQLLFDENGYLQFWGQQYDDRGNPIGTRYDEAGNPILDWYGNPEGTQYGDDGNPLLDWRGNMVIEYY